MKPIEELVGMNRGCVRQILGRVHCSSSILVAARAARPKNLRNAPVALRRGWAKCVIDTWREYAGMYRDVVSGSL